MDITVKMDREPTWRKKPQPLTTYCGVPVFVDEGLAPDTVKLIHPDTGETLAEMKIKR